MTYEQVLAEINYDMNHLLIANGFNYGLGVKTGYKDILNEMIESKSSLYTDAQLYFEQLKKTLAYCNYTNSEDGLCNDTANFCVSVHMNPEATHEFSVDFAMDLKEYIDSME